MSSIKKIDLSEIAYTQAQTSTGKKDSSFYVPQTEIIDFALDATKKSLEKIIPSNSADINTEIKVGEAALVGINTNSYEELEQARIDYLYDGNGIPQSVEENEQYLEYFPIEYISVDGEKQTIDLKLHKKVGPELQAAFKELETIGFNIDWYAGGTMREWGKDQGYDGKFYQSGHVFGLAIDINVLSNCCIENGEITAGDHYSPGEDPLSITPEVAQIFEKHGFYWGGNWDEPKDYMHFCYVDH